MVRTKKEVNETPFMSIREVARSTGLPESFLRGMLKRGELPGVYSGVKYLVNIPVLLARMDAQSTGVGA